MELADRYLSAGMKNVGLRSALARSTALLKCSTACSMPLVEMCPFPFSMQTRTAAIGLKCRLPRSRFKVHDWDAMSKPATAAAAPLTVQVAAR